MDELERLRTEVWMTRNRANELEQQLQQAHEQLNSYADRLTLTDQERAILSGHADGCIRVGELQPILRRFLPRAA